MRKKAGKQNKPYNRHNTIELTTETHQSEGFNTKGRQEAA